MNFLKRLAKKLFPGTASYFVIRNSCGDPYLLRWSFFDLLGFSLKLHVILRSDDDRAPHDHPWSFLTLMLKGGYWEWRFATNDDIKRLRSPEKHIVRSEDGRDYLKTWIKPGTLRFCKAPYAHRLELPVEEPVARPSDPSLQHTVIEGFFQPNIQPMFRPAITLVLTWPKFREWGFYTKDGWIKWSDFLRNNARHDC